MARSAQEMGTLIKTVAGLSMDGFIKVCVVVILVYFASDEILEKFDIAEVETVWDSDTLVMMLERMDDDDEDDMMMQDAFIQATQVQQLMEQRIQFEIEALEQTSVDHVNFLHD